MSRPPTYRAFLATSPATIRAAQALRGEIYVGRMGIVPPDHPYVDGERLVDPYDAYSHHLVLVTDGVVVGTGRLTLADEGPLEIEEVRDFGDRLGPRRGLCEVTRLMVLPEHRCWEATRALFWGVWQAIEALGVERVAAAGKVGSLGRYYRNYGLRLVDPEPFAYPLIPDCTYQLMVGDFGRARSARRLFWRGLFGGSWVGAHLAPRLLSSLYRTGLRTRARHRHAPAAPAPAASAPTPEPASEPLSETRGAA